MSAPQSTAHAVRAIPDGGARVQLRDLSWRTGGRDILSRITLDVEPGEILGVIGINGSGKSTLLRLLAGLLRPTSGEVSVAGQPLARLTSRARARQVALVSQEDAVPASLTVQELVALGRVPHARSWSGISRRDQAAITAALHAVELEYAAQQSLDHLSGGERRRASLARGLAQEATVLLLDEPTNHLDVRHQLALLRLLRDLGKTVVIAIHDLDLAATFCDRLAALHDGEVLAHGTPDDVLTPRILHDVFGVLATHVVHPLTGKTHLLFSLDESEPHP